jgi:glycosyltransferase involved in cell wall biosynthesis
MLTVASLANLFPSPVEPYVGQEIEELRRRGLCVIAGSVWKARTREEGALTTGCAPEVVLQPLQGTVLLRAAWLCLTRWNRISPLIVRVICRGAESPLQRLKALLHTWLGACYAVLLEERGIEHIHVHHGYFGSWVAMVAARLLGVGFTMTLHGSDLLLHGTYLDVKLKNCALCVTVSEYNRRYILEHYPGVDAEKVTVSRMGADVSERTQISAAAPMSRGEGFQLLAVGRLHEVKDHAFLVRACAELDSRGVNFECSIAGEGLERRNLESLIRRHGLEEKVVLLGHVAREQMDSLYERADVVVLTSRSEGIPLALMEAMARGKIVLVPEITGIPELVIGGKTGFLYEAGSLDDFVDRLLCIRSILRASPHPDLPHPDLHSDTVWAARRMDWVRHAARVHVFHNFNRSKNLECFCDVYIQQIAQRTESVPHENPILQQI